MHGKALLSIMLVSKFSSGKELYHTPREPFVPCRLMMLLE